MLRRRGVLRRVLHLMVLLSSSFGAAVPAAGQATTGVIVGVVADAQGGVLPGVTLAVRNAETCVLRAATTEVDGRYRVAGLPPGTYEVKAELAGFAPAETRELTLTIGSELICNLTLQLEGVREAVTVAGQAPGSASSSQRS